MAETSRAIGREGGDGHLPRQVESVSAPEAKVKATARPLTPTEAERIARQVSADRARRHLPNGKKPVLIPSLPPAAKSPARVTPVLLVFMQIVLDIFAIVSAFVLAYLLRREIDILGKFVEPDLPTYTTMLAIAVGTLLITFFYSKLYSLKRGFSRVDEFYKITAAVSIGAVLSIAINSLVLGERFVYSRQILLTGWVLAILLVTIVRITYSLVVGELRKAGLDRARVLLIGTGPTAAVVADRLKRHRSLGYRVVGAIDNNPKDHPAVLKIGDVPVVGDLSRLADTVRRFEVDEVIVALSGASDAHLREIIGLVQDESVSVKIYPDAFQLMTQNEVSVDELSGLPLLSVKDVALRGWNRRLKRGFDILFSAVVIVLTAPLMLFLAASIKVTSAGPVFFIQDRVGLDGHAFKLVKFRTMRADVDPSETTKFREDMPGWTRPNDPRRTKIGAFLRRFSLDELPQFFNVLVGEMSVVGPRPEQPEYVKEFAQRIPQYLRRHREKAGITGWAQVNGLRGDSSIELRTAADLYYVENWSLLFDLKIIARTVVAMVLGKNAY